MKNEWTYKKTITTILIVVVAIWILFKPAAILGILGKIFSVLEPFILGACIAFVLNEMLKIVEKGWTRAFKNSSWKGKNRLKRPVCLFVSFIAVCAIFTLLAMIIVPEIRNTIQILKMEFPDYVEEIERLCNKVLDYLDTFGITYSGRKIDFDLVTEKVSETVAAKKSKLITGAISATTSIFSTTVNLILAIVFAFFVLAEKETLARQFKKLLKVSISEQKYNAIMETLKLSNQAFSSFVTGQLLEAFLFGVLCFIGMLVLGLPYPGAISVLIGFTALIPIIGAFFGTGLGAIMIFFVKPIKALWFIIFIILLQQFDENFMYPRVVGNKVGLPGIWVLFSVAVGGSLFGLVGMLISVPISSVVYELLKRYVKKGGRNREQG